MMAMIRSYQGCLSVFSDETSSLHVKVYEMLLDRELYTILIILLPTVSSMHNLSHTYPSSRGTG